MKKKDTPTRRPDRDAPILPPNPDLFLDEDALVRLAMKELHGRLPPPVLERLSVRSGGGDGGRESATAELPQPRRTVLSHEMEMRGWTVRELAKEAGFSASEALALAHGNQRITPEIARKLARAFATSAEFWL